MTLEEIIRNRRTVKPSKMNGKIIPERMIGNMLEAANWAPTHGRTEPWRFIVLNNEQARIFYAEHALLYKKHTPEEKYLETSFEKLIHQADLVSHIVIVYMAGGTNPKIPEIEEVAAVGAAIQNLLLVATSHQISSFWSTGGLTHHRSMTEVLSIPEFNKIMGIIHLGYSDDPPTEGSRKTSWQEKTRSGR